MHGAFLHFWLQVDIQEAEQRHHLWEVARRRLPAATRGQKIDVPWQYTDEWRERVGQIRESREVVAFLDELVCCADEATPSKSGTWRPLSLPRSAIGYGGRRAGLRRLEPVRIFLEQWVAAFFDTRLVAIPGIGLGLRARRDFKSGDVVVAGFRDEESPPTPSSQTADEVPIHGPFALLNAGCERHANLRFSFAESSGKTSAVAATDQEDKKIRKTAHLLAPYGDGASWTCAMRNCRARVASSVDE